MGIGISIGLLEVRNGYLHSQRSFRYGCIAIRIVRCLSMVTECNRDRPRSFRGR